MINLPRTIPIASGDRLTIRKLDAHKVERIPPLTDLPEQQVQPPSDERRKRRDRRQHHQPDYPFCTRARGDRRNRRDPDHPPIDIEA